MAILGLQGIRGGVGTTSITAALAWSLQLLGESVLVIDASPDNLLRLSFNVDFASRGGWARSVLDGQDWRDAGLRYTSQLDVLPFGQLTTNEWDVIHQHDALNQLAALLQALKTQQQYHWVLIDLPHGFSTVDAAIRRRVRSCFHHYQTRYQLPYSPASAAAACGVAYSD